MEEAHEYYCLGCGKKIPKERVKYLIESGRRVEYCASCQEEYDPTPLKIGIPQASGVPYGDIDITTAIETENSEVVDEFRARNTSSKKEYFSEKYNELDSLHSEYEELKYINLEQELQKLTIPETIEEGKVYLYTDESCYLSRKHPYMVIGGVFIPVSAYSQELSTVNKIIESLNKDIKIRKLPELKWTYVSKKKEGDLIHRLLYRLATETNIYNNFSCIVIPNKLDFKRYHNDDKELAFAKFYYLYVSRRCYFYVKDLKRPCKFIVVMDDRDSPYSQEDIKKLTNKYLLQKTDGKANIVSIKRASSQNEIFIQLVDLLIGAVSYRFNRESKVYQGQKQELRETRDRISKMVVGLLKDRKAIWRWKPS
ncbi:DUF3800 domain-containing protein [Hydrogenivirga sp.]